MTSMKKALITILILVIANVLLGIYLFVYTCNYAELNYDPLSYSYEDYLTDSYKARQIEYKNEALKKYYEEQEKEGDE